VIKLMKLRPYTGDIVAPSPNHDARRAQVIEGIVLHATADRGNETQSLAWLRSPKSRVSCHLLVNRAGRATRLVGDQQRAWHAGASRWRGRSDVNSITLGIELANRNDGEPYTDAQYARVAEIVAHYCRQGIPLDAVISHSEIAPGRRKDPFGWDWDRFRAMVQDELRPAAVTLPAGGASASAVRGPESGGAGRAAAPAPGRVPASTTLQPPAGTPPKAVPAGTTRKPPASTTPGRVPASSTLRPPTGSTLRAVQPGAPLKPVLRSRTLWVNGLTVLASGVAIIAETLELAFRIGLTLP
jgi:hypothetical protein